MKENILYTFRRCPYAMRARWALLLTRQVVIWREVLLKDKPQELFDISSKGTVPVLLTSNGDIIDESIDIMRWALMTSKSFEILCKGDSGLEEQIYDLIKKNDGPFKYHLDRYKYANRFNQLELEYHKNSARKILIEWNSKLMSKNNDTACWLVNAKETLADWSLWPFVRQYRNVDPVSFDNDKDLIRLRNWLESYSSNSKFEILMQKSIPWSPDQSPKYFPNLNSSENMT